MANQAPLPDDSDHPPIAPVKRARRSLPPGTTLLVPVGDAVIDQLVTDLNVLSRLAGLDLVRDAGTLILKRLHGGDVGAWRTHGDKDASFRKLALRAEAGELPYKASWLCRAVELVELEGRLGVATWQHLTISHIRMAFPLPEPEQKALLLRADEQRWTVIRMEREIRALRGTAARPGRPPDAAFVRGVRLFDKWLGEPDWWFGDFDQIEELDAEEREKMRETVAGMRRKCEELEERLRGGAGEEAAK